jgi:acyl-[acyl-carrier-protein] desaturase
MSSLRTLQQELSPVARRLVDRHLANAKDWMPHEYVPWSRGRDFEPGECFDPASSPLSPAAQSALFVNLLTEDNLPYYFWTIDRTFGSGGDGDDSVWGEWTKRWTAEEGRHSIVMRDYLVVTRSIDPVALEQGRMSQLQGGQVPMFDRPLDGLVYVALQELATRISHTNTGRLIEDPLGRKIMARVAGDEGLHHVFYRDLVSAAIEIDPSAVVESIERNVRDFAMPGVGIPGFASHARVIAHAGIYDFAVHHDSILEPVVLEQWGLASIEGLSAEAEQARARCIDYIDRVGTLGHRLQEKRQARGDGDLGMVAAG